MAEEASSSAALREWATSAPRPLAVVFFWADFHPPSKKGGQMDTVFAHLATQHALEAAFIKADVDVVADVAEEMGVTMVPTFVFLRAGRLADKLEGCTPPELVARLEKHIATSRSIGESSRKQARPAAPAASDAASKSAGSGGSAAVPALDDALRARLRKLISSARVFLFMKGIPSAPKCKFSRAMVELLNEHGVQFAAFDVLSDEAVRQGLKEFSGWPTFPQLFVGGKLLGGMDVVKEMIEEDSFLETIHAAPVTQSTPSQNSSGGGPANGVAPAGHGSAGPDPKALTERLQKLTNQAPVMLFMKGVPSAPRCGFSAKIVEILQNTGVAFGHFNILDDNDVRQGLKTFSNWPTFPQLYVNGKLVGGLDIVQELAAEDELEDVLRGE